MDKDYALIMRANLNKTSPQKIHTISGALSLYETEQARGERLGWTEEHSALVEKLHTRLKKVVDSG
jgi:hypothetical protein